MHVSNGCCQQKQVKRASNEKFQIWVAGAVFRLRSTHVLQIVLHVVTEVLDEEDFLRHGLRKRRKRH